MNTDPLARSILRPAGAVLAMSAMLLAGCTADRQNSPRPNCSAAADAGNHNAVPYAVSLGEADSQSSPDDLAGQNGPKRMKAAWNEVRGYTLPYLREHGTNWNVSATVGYTSLSQMAGAQSEAAVIAHNAETQLGIPEAETPAGTYMGPADTGMLAFTPEAAEKPCDLV